MSYLSDMDNIDMTYSDFVNPLKMLLCSEKHPVSGATYGYTKQVANYMRLYQQHNFLQILIYSITF